MSAAALQLGLFNRDALPEAQALHTRGVILFIDSFGDCTHYRHHNAQVSPEVLRRSKKIQAQAVKGTWRRGRKQSDNQCEINAMSDWRKSGDRQKNRWETIS